MSTSKTALFTLIAFVLLSTCAYAVPVITNGTFDTPAGWSYGEPGACSGLTSEWTPAYGNPAGSVIMNQCGEANTDPTVSQTVSGFTIGDLYDLQWDFNLYDADNNGLTKTFGVFLNTDETGTPIYIGGITNGHAILGPHPDPWVTAMTSFVATQTTNTIWFAAELDTRTPGVTVNTDISYLLDNVSVSDEGPAVPEPSMLLLLGTGLVGLSRRLRKPTI